MNNINLKERKALVIGTTGEGENFSFGGSDKIKGLREALLKLYGEVSLANTYGWKRHPLRTLSKLKKEISNANDIYIVLSVNGTKLLCPSIIRWAKRKNANLLYAMVGIGNLEDETKKDNHWDNITSLIQKKNLWHRGNIKISKILSNMDAVLVETKRLKEMTEYLYGLNNVSVLENGRNYSIQKDISQKNPADPIIHFVYFANVAKAKGADLLLKAVSLLNEKNVRGFDVSIYGRLGESDKSWFDPDSLPKNVLYKGVCLSNKIETLRQYDCLVFPSIYVEGMPGTIVDARFAGLVVVASTFTFADELVTNGVDGFLFKRGDYKDLANCMESLLLRQDVCQIKKASLLRADNYTCFAMENKIVQIMSEIMTKK